MSIDERIDPFDLLSTYQAPAGWNDTVELTGPDADTAAVSLLERVVGGHIVATGPRRRHLRLVTGVIVAASLGGAVVAAAALLSRSPDTSQLVSCWSEPVLPPDEQVGLGWDGVGDPVDICADQWRDGGLGRQGPPEPLQACVTLDGLAAIMPGDATTCTQLGMSTFAPIEFEPEPNDVLRRRDVDELERVFASEFNPDRCLTAAAAEQAVLSRLDQLGFSGWSVSVAATSSDDETCATVFVDPATESVSIVLLVPD